jgi:hypothetical protein
VLRVDEVCISPTHATWKRIGEADCRDPEVRHLVLMAAGVWIDASALDLGRSPSSLHNADVQLHL